MLYRYKFGISSSTVADIYIVKHISFYYNVQKDVKKTEGSLFPHACFEARGEEIKCYISRSSRSGLARSGPYLARAAFAWHQFPGWDEGRDVPKYAGQQKDTVSNLVAPRGLF
jgi:hypothetical protein